MAIDRSKAVEVSKKSGEVQRLLDKYSKAVVTYARELSSKDVQRIMREYPEYLPIEKPKALWSVHWSLPGVGIPERPMVLVYIDATTGEIVGTRSRWLEKKEGGLGS